MKISRHEEPIESQKREIKSAIFFLVCFVGCLYQMIKVSMQYFSYATVTNLRMENPEYFYPPAMSICFPYASILNFTLAFRHKDLKNYAEELSKDLNVTIDYRNYQMKQYHPNEFDLQFTNYLNEHFSVAQIMEMTNRIEDWMTECMVINPEDYVPRVTKNLSECLNVWSIETYVKNDQKCFEVSFKSHNLTKNRQDYPDSDVDYIYNFERFTMDPVYASYIWYLEINSTPIANIEYIYIYLHPYYRKPAGQIDPMLFYPSPGRNHVAAITYSRIKSILLPKPYKTGCKKYFINRDHEINECIIKKSLAKYNKVPLATILSYTSQVKTFTISHYKENLTLYKELENLIFNCYSLFPQKDCVWEIYKPELRSVYEGGSGYQIVLKVPSEPDVENRFIPKLTFLEYLIYSGSVLGIWYGISIIQLPFILSFMPSSKWFTNMRNSKNSVISVQQFKNRC